MARFGSQGFALGSNPSPLRGLGGYWDVARTQGYALG